MQVHLVDGTYELFRRYFAVPKKFDSQGRECGAVRGVLASLLSMTRSGATHLAVATDHVIESFRNDLYPGYKTAAGVPADLLSQFPLLEQAVKALGFVVWPMIEFEADDALAAGAALAAADERVTQVLVCTPDKDLSQCVVGDRVVQFDRRKKELRNEAAVVEKFGVVPRSIPDYLALVGDTADGYPGLLGWGAKSTATVLAKYGHLEAIPQHGTNWLVRVSNAGGLAETLHEHYADAELYRTLATLRTNIPLFTNVDELLWRGPTADFAGLAEILDAESGGTRSRQPIWR